LKTGSIQYTLMSSLRGENDNNTGKNLTWSDWSKSYRLAIIHLCFLI